ncbi:MAG: uroporphyrinogen-III synthase [Marinibacterium sp.]
MVSTDRFSGKPAGPVLLLTRPAAASQRFVDRLGQDMDRDILDCLRLVVSPLVRIAPLKDRIDLGPARGLILTSANGVAMAGRLLPHRDMPVYTVGQATAQAAELEGWKAVCAGRTADELVAGMPGLAPPVPLAHLHGRHTRGNIAVRLSEAGIPVRGHAIYDQLEEKLTSDAASALAGPAPVIAPLFSPRTAALLTDQGRISAPFYPIALSQAVAAEFARATAGRPVEMHICSSPTLQAMSAALCDVAHRLCRVEGLRGDE